MRVVGGSAKGRKLQAVPGEITRPVLDRVKTALFDILRPAIPDAAFLDLFAGSGSVGIEALSQGAAWCTYIDINRAAVETIKQNLAATRLEALAEVRQMDAFAYLRSSRRSFDVVYIAPPQYRNLWNEALHAVAERPDLVKPSGLIIVQIDPKEYEAVNLSDFSEHRTEKYGNTLLAFYKKVERER